MDPSDRVCEEQLLRSAVLAGDEDAWRRWYDASFDALYAYAMWRSGGLEDLAEEVVQETWLTAVRRMRRFDPRRGSFVGWLRGIAVNVLRNRLRRESTRRSRTGPLDGDPAGGPPAEKALEQRERAERIAAALAALPERYEEVLRAKYLERLSVNEIAADRGETPKAIESLLTRARQAFRKQYAPGD